MIRIFIILKITFEEISIPGLMLFPACKIIRVSFCDIYPFMLTKRKETGYYWSDLAQGLFNESKTYRKETLFINCVKYIFEFLFCEIPGTRKQVQFLHMVFVMQIYGKPDKNGKKN